MATKQPAKAKESSAGKRGTTARKQPKTTRRLNSNWGGKREGAGRPPIFEFDHHHHRLVMTMAMRGTFTKREMIHKLAYMTGDDRLRKMDAKTFGKHFGETLKAAKEMITTGVIDGLLENAIDKGMFSAQKFWLQAMENWKITETHEYDDLNDDGEPFHITFDMGETPAMKAKREAEAAE